MAAKQLQDISANLPDDAQERKQIYIAARELMLQAESKWDTHHRLFLGMVPPTLARIGMDMGVFRALASEPNREWTASELATKSHGETSFIARMMRAFAAYQMLSQLSPTTYKATSITRVLAQDDAEIACLCHHDLDLPLFHALPGYLAREGYKTPDDSANAAFHDAFNTKMEVMDWLGTQPKMAKQLFDYMTVQRADQVSWMDQPQISLKDFEISEKDTKDGRAMFVDVGGGSGHQSIALKRKHPELKGRVAVEDKELMTTQASSNPAIKELDIELLTHDFLTPQPSNVKGAKVYYTRTVLHDWNDGVCATLLTQLRDAMAPDSVIVIDEAVVPEVGVDFKTVDYDMIMMAFVSAKERTEPQWRELMGSVGLKIRDIVCYDEQTRDSLIFVVKA